MISTNDFHSGLTIEYDGDLYVVLESQHVKPGKGQAFVRTKLRNLNTGAVIDKTFNAGEKVPRAMVERRSMQFLYQSDDEYHLMDTENYEQFAIQRELLGDQVKFLKENMILTVAQHEGRTFSVELPNTVELEVVETDPGVRGDTATGGSKPAKLETGAVVKVPLFIEVGEKVKVDTRSGEYISRV